MIFVAILTIFTLASVGILLWQFFTGKLSDELPDYGDRWIRGK